VNHHKAHGSDDAEAALRILLEVARADGQMSVDEERAFAILAHARPAPSSSPRIDVREEASRMSPEARRATLEAALALAAVDGCCGPEQHALLAELRDAVGEPEFADLEGAEASWLRAMKAPLERLSTLEVQFLRTIAKDEELGDKEYGALVSWHGARRNSVLAAALRPVVLP
jgi:pyruvate/2-oxoglutarate dehydrogenase complex dihydrolipoamide acyltransferase (E2) component